MSKLYVFGIGGTGARVLRSLTMLLASGVRCGKDIVPIIIDPDSSAASLTEAVRAFDEYKVVRDKLNYTNGGAHFFGTKVEEQVQRYVVPLAQIQNKTFQQYISLSTMSQANEALMRMLFSEDNLNADMQVGFKGNPNMGSVVLNQFVGSNEFQQFANSFQQGDSIFIISSIFGGTGASGFPLLLKTLRSNNTLPNFNLLNTAAIGAISVLPYFTLTVDGQSSIDSSGFIDKTKAALSYYDTNITGTKQIDRLYYIADTTTPTYDNHEGGASQDNQAHLVELLSALAVVDFANTGLNASSGQTQCFEYGIQNDVASVDFNELGMQTQNTIKAPLTQFILFRKYLKNVLRGQNSSQSWAKDADFDEQFFGGAFERSVEEMLKLFEQWLGELDGNQRSFSPFDLTKEEDIFNMVRGAKPKKTWFKNNYSLFDDVLNKERRPDGISKEQWFVDLFYGATRNMVKDKFNF